MGQKDSRNHQASRWGNKGARKSLRAIEEWYSDSPKWKVICCTASKWVRRQGADNTHRGGRTGTSFPAVVGACPSLPVWWGGKEWGSRDICWGWPRKPIFQYRLPHSPNYQEPIKVIHCSDWGRSATSDPDSWKWRQSLLGRKRSPQCSDCWKH